MARFRLHLLWLLSAVLFTLNSVARGQSAAEVDAHPSADSSDVLSNLDKGRTSENPWASGYRSPISAPNWAPLRPAETQSPDAQFPVRMASLEDQGKSIPDQAQEPGDATAGAQSLWSDNDEASQGAATGLPPGTRNGFFQSVHFSSTWLPALDNNDLGLTDLTLYAKFGLPAPTRDSPLLITPGFESHHLAGPMGADLPEELYDAYVQFMYIRKLAGRLGMIASVTPGIHSDFKQSDGDSIRVPGNLLATWQWTERLKLLVGAVYLDRPDISVLPAFGVIWTPDESIKMDLAVPRPRIAWNFAQVGEVQHWAYIGGEFAGGSWAVRRDSGVSDTLGYSAYHLLMGWERNRFFALGSQVEFGYAFGRRLEYDSDGLIYEPNGTILLRANLSY